MICKTEKLLFRFQNDARRFQSTPPYFDFGDTVERCSILVKESFLYVYFEPNAITIRSGLFLLI